MTQKYSLMIAVIAVTLLALGVCVLYESSTIVLEHVSVYITGLPLELDGFCIAHITDFHGRKLDTEGKLIKALISAEPDIIVLTGDYVNRHVSEIENITPFIRAVSTVAPVYGVSGNHDYWAGWETVAEKLRATGVLVLENEHQVISRSGSLLVLAGVNDPFTGNADLPAALADAPTAPTVVLAHAPTWFEARKHKLSSAVFDNNAALEQALARVNLTLAGHTHGGQIKLPFVGAVSNASGRMFPRDYIEGLSDEGNGWLYISRGIGYTFLPIRFLSRAQVAIVTLRAR